MVHYIYFKFVQSLKEWEKYVKGLLLYFIVKNVYFITIIVLKILSRNKNTQKVFKFIISIIIAKYVLITKYNNL